MFTLSQLKEYLAAGKADFELIPHEKPILTVEDAARYFDLEQYAPGFVIQTDRGLTALMVNARRGEVNLKAMGHELGYGLFQLANPRVAAQATGYKTPFLPLFGHNLPCLFDKSLTIHDYIYGGTGDLGQTLRIKPEDVIRLNRVVSFVE